MVYGKRICKTLKELRKRIADANEIPYEIEECPHKGRCPGTCPKCEEEVRYLERELERRENAGKPIRLKDLMSEEELRKVFASGPAEAEEPFLPAGIPAPPKLFYDIFNAVETCLRESAEYPDVALFICPVDLDVLTVRRPATEGDALFAYDYCDWRTLVNGGRPDRNAIEDVAFKYLSEQKPLQGDMHEPDEEIHLEGMPIPPERLEGDPRPLEGIDRPLEGIMPDPSNNHNFAATVMEHILAEEKGNVTFSPIGLANILVMLQEGVEFEGKMYDDIYYLLDGASFHTPQSTNPEVCIEHATSLWFDKKAGLVKPSYAEQLHNYFKAELHKANFHDTEGVKKELDEWVSRQTHGMIQSLNMKVSPLALLILIDALYLKAKWENPFDAEDTCPDTFTNADGTRVEVDMMHQWFDDAEYEETERYQVIRLPYAGGELSMTIVLPRDEKELHRLMTSDCWLNIDQMNGEVDFSMPRFKFDIKMDFKSTLSKLGFADLFDRDDALPEITDELAHISQIFQQCNIAVDEEGTEAAAVTVVECEVGCPPPIDEPIVYNMHINRPFGYAITDKKGEIIFMAVVKHLNGSPEKPKHKEIYLQSITVAGTSHIPNIEDLADHIKEGTELSLVRNAGNKHDKNAVALYLNGQRVGYVSKEKNEIIAHMMDAGKTFVCRVTDADWQGEWLRIEGDVFLVEGKDTESMAMAVEQLIEIVKEAAECMPADHFEVTQKGGYSNIVTTSDVAVQEFLRERLSKAIPGSGFLCEEEDRHDLSHEYVWIIDPIDGTANYSRGIRECAICVGLKHNDKMEMAVVYLPYAKELFHAVKDNGAWLNGRPIHVSDRPFQNAVLCTALPVYHKEYTDICSEIIKEAFKQCNDIRRFGSAATELCYLAMGRCELYFEYKLSPWDFAAASLILEEAGGILARPDGNKLEMTELSGVVAANSRENLTALLDIIKRKV